MDKLGATIVQTEDEIAACMTAMGGVYAGVRGFTCTSGPGLSLMAESLSMASMAELPMVVSRRTTFRPIHRYGYKGRTIRY